MSTWSSNVDWRPFCELVGQANQIVLMGHVRPDGDAIGSNLAMLRALETLGKRVMFVNGQEVPPSLAFLEDAKRVRVAANLTAEERAFVDDADLVVIIDVSSWQQLGADASEIVREKSRRGTPIAVIDHHAVGDEFGDARCVDPTADSAGSLVFSAIQALGVDFTRAIAAPLFIAIATDTGWFRFGSTRSSTLRRAAELIDAGVKVDQAYRDAYEQDSYGRFKLLGAAIHNAERFLNDKGVVMSLSLRDFDAAGAIPADSEDLVNEPLSVAGMLVSIIAIEQPDGSVKASFRSRCALDCAELARTFGGGGHKQAAGASLDVDLQAAVQLLKERAEEFYRRACQQ